MASFDPAGKLGPADIELYFDKAGSLSLLLTKSQTQTTDLSNAINVNVPLLLIFY
jgi:hypothetical protein